MMISGALQHALSSPQASRVYQIALGIAAWMIGSSVTAEFLDYWLRQLLASSLVYRCLGRELS
jgi:hypothetical protein